MPRFNRGDGIVSIKHRPKSVYDYCIVSLYNEMYDMFVLSPGPT